MKQRNIPALTIFADWLYVRCLDGGVEVSKSLSFSEVCGGLLERTRD